jgi:hypothetical protein
MNQVYRHAIRGSVDCVRAIFLFSIVLFSQVCASQELSAEVDWYELIGNTLLSQTQIQSAINGATGKLILANIQENARRLQEAYRKAGLAR